MPLASQRYGKDRVRVLRVVRGADGVHEVHEAEVSVSLEGDFADTYLTGDNARVVPTDTMKNTVHIFAQHHLEAAVPERFALALGDHFLGKYPQVARVRVEVAVRPWDRYLPTGAAGAHPHAFTGRTTGTPFARAEAGRGEDVRIEGGRRDVLLLKSTASSFKGFPRCDLTTLPETDDRILATRLAATWTFAGRDADFAAADAAIPPALLDTFAGEFSPSLQHTLFRMGEAALAAAAPAVSEIHLAMPNKHYLPVNFQPFGRENAGEIFLPTDEPHGQIEARIVRAAAAAPAR